MKNTIRISLVALGLVAVLLSSCASDAVVDTVEMEIPVVGDEETEAVVVTAVSQSTPAPTPAPAGGGHVLPDLPDRPDRLIVKDATLQLLVEDTDIAIDRATQVVGDTGGYIISSRVWYQDWRGENFKYATITIGVPVDQFERAMRRLRDLALQVVDESASGQDVTDEYVDLQSRLENLEATRDRIRQFLDQAENVEEALRVNQELAAVEAQIEQVQGRMNYLFDRAAYSTITINLEPDLPPAPIPTPTPTPAPPAPWSPSDTVQAAGRTLGSILRVAVEMAIWLGIVVAPLVAPPLLLVWGGTRWLKKKRAGQ
jgi:hypothetical protein